MEALPYPCALRDEILSQPQPVDSVDKLWSFAVKKRRGKVALGSRQLLGEEIEPAATPDGKQLTKISQGPEYHWRKYEDVDSEVQWAAQGLAEVGLRPKDKIVVYADTRAEWLVAALGCFKNNLTLVTLYTNLGEDGIVYGINQTRVETILTSRDLLPKLIRMLPQLPSLKTIIFFENPTKEEIPESAAEGRKLVPFSKLLELGKKSSSLDTTPPTAEDVAIIMYTSGSTGDPKGAILTHRHLTAAILACLTRSYNLCGSVRDETESYFGYLPLAHIFELTMEIVVLLMGIRVGYSSPLTLTDASPGVKKGQQGDAQVLKPTAMCTVPLVLDRIYKGVNAKISGKGAFFQNLFNMFYRYKLEALSQGYETPILDKLVFSKFKTALGGNLRLIVSGGAPLSPDVHDFLRACFGVHLVQGYGLTETAGGVTLQDIQEFNVGSSGYPLPGIKMKFEDWPEGGYTVQDPEGPRGEILINCDWVAQGYYEMPDKTAESFFTDEKTGDRWFRTGDIGQYNQGGTIKIVDRKKDLVKLQMGEYVSLGKVESCLKIHPIVDNICVYADSAKHMTIALIVPDDARLQELAKKLGLATTLAREELCKNAKVIGHVLETLTSHARSNLEKFEIPRAVGLLPDIWTPDTGLVTAALKLKRKQIQFKHQEIIDDLYGGLDGSNSSGVKRKLP